MGNGVIRAHLSALPLVMTASPVWPSFVIFLRLWGAIGEAPDTLLEAEWACITERERLLLTQPHRRVAAIVYAWQGTAGTLVNQLQTRSCAQLTNARASCLVE